jgi:hypothetical protein
LKIVRCTVDRNLWGPAFYFVDRQQNDPSKIRAVGVDANVSPHLKARATATVALLCSANVK